MKRVSAVFLLIFLLLALAGCGGRQESVEEPQAPAPEEEAEEKPPKYLPESSPSQESGEPDDEPEALTEAEQEAREAAAREKRVMELLAGMSLEEKVGQLFFAHCPQSGAAEEIAKYHLGGVLLFTRDYQDSAGNWLTAEAFIAKLGALQAAAMYDTRIPLFIGSDEEGGTVTRASRNPHLFPEKSRSPRELYAAGGLAAVLNDAAQKSYLLRNYGVNVNFAPVCDVSNDPSDFIYARSFGGDAQETAQYAAKLVAVMADSGIGSVLKHFPGYGGNADTHTGVAVDERPFTQFESCDLVPFAAGVRAGAPFVLMSHNLVLCLDDSLPASLSPAVHALLRDKLGFAGVILTDDLGMDAVKAYAKGDDAAVLALLAGNDMIVTPDYRTQIPAVLAAVRGGRIGEEQIDASAARVLRVKLSLGLMED